MIDRLCAPPPPNASPLRSAAASGNPAASSFLSWVQPVAAEQSQTQLQTQTQADAGALRSRGQGDDRPPVPWHENPNANIAIANRNIDPDPGLASDVIAPKPLHITAIVPQQWPTIDVDGSTGLVEAFGTDPGTTIQIQAQGENGVHQLISTPWRLMATGELEYSVASAGNPAGLPDRSTAIVPPRQAQRIDGPMRRAEGHSFAGLSVAGTATAAHGMYRNESSTANASMSRQSPEEVLSMSQAFPATADWLSRWFRWVERDGRDLALWVRDYRIGDREAAGVVNGVLTFVREHGIPVGRIVVNGREHWSRQQPQDHEEPQTCR